MPRSLTVWFFPIITVSIILFSFALFVMFIEPSRLVDPVPIDPVVWSTVQPNVPQHCLDMINKRSQKSSRVFAQVAPPWVDLVENVGNATVETTMAKMQQLYVHVFAAHTRRLGNQLFNYASLFGVAWRHRDRIPLWPNRKTQLRSVFNLRIPIDRNDTVIGVR